jgi:transcriptional regulator with XRE-family HTH domain
VRLRTRALDVAARHGCESQQDIARFLGVSEATISLILSGKREIGQHFQKAVIKKLGPLGYGWSDLFWYEAEPDEQREEVPA